MSRAIGIDLGTTFCVAAVILGHKPVIVPSAEGSNMVPSVVAMSLDGRLLIGDMARRQAVLNPENTIHSIKRFMGRRWGEPPGIELPIEEDARRVSYRTTRGPNNLVKVVLGGKDYSPEEISAMLLQKLKVDAEAYLGDKVTDVVIAVPSHFNDSQRNATKNACTIAGPHVMRIISESNAAALAYGADKKNEGTIAVYDLGGGTFNISILQIGEGVFQVKSTSGNTHLGGDDFDQRIMDWLCDEFEKNQGKDLRKDKIAMCRIKEAAEKAKTELSTVHQTEINLPFITSDAKSPNHLNMTLTRATLERLCADLIERTLDPCCRQALRDASLEAKDIDNVIIVGDQTRMPLVQEKVKQFFGREVSRKGLDIDKAVALGAAIEAGTLKGESEGVLLMDVIPFTLGIETLGGVATPLISRNTTIPTSKSQIFSTASDNQPSVEVHVLQGERAMACDNQTLGHFILDGIPPAPRGVPQIEVTFDTDANGILNVSAQDKSTGRKQQVTMTASSGLSKWEVDRMRKVAEKRAADL